MTDAVRDSIDIAAEPADVWEVIADFERYPEWQPEFRDVEVLETDEDGWGTRVRFAVDAKVLQATLVLAYTYTDATMSWTLESGTGVRTNDGRYELEWLDDGRTRLHYMLTVEPSVPLPGPLRRQAARRIVEGALRGVRRTVEGARG